ncbi:MAG: MBL fold metallo-hydrolase [Desulfamplus sp.]|nr:MBL fold metallo-hydrolase [Desulfamplus sp.]
MINDAPSLSICPLASGSGGNAIYISGGKSAILLDAGLSGVELERRMAARGLNLESIDAVVVSHEHTDHVKGAGVLSRRYGIPLFISERTLKAAAGRLGKVDRITHFRCGHPFDIGELSLNPFSISHDAGDPSGFTVERHRCKLAVATDLGVATTLVRHHLQGSSLIYIEANHDPEMLRQGPYPWHLKQRVKSRLGHLSNGDAGELICQVREGYLNRNGHRPLGHVILGHLSQDNNTPEKALQTVCEILDDSNIKVSVAMPDSPGEMIHLG